MQWQDEGVILAVRRHGESSAVVSLLTAAHGRHAGWVRGATSRRSRPVYQPGNRVMAVWRARLPEQLGSLSAELLDPIAARLLDQPERLAGLGATLALLHTSLAERDPHPNLYRVLGAFLEVLMEDDSWPETYVRFELALLAELGFGLDLRRCAVTGQSDDLAYVSPRSGRAVSRAGAGDYASRLLPLPAFLIERGRPDPDHDQERGSANSDQERGSVDSDQVLAGLRLTGAFLRRHLFDASERPMPDARQRLLDRLARSTKA